MMQKDNRRRTLGTIEALRRQKEAYRRLITLGILCLLVPPLGLLFLWRSRYISGALKSAYSLVTLLVMTLVLTLLRSGGESSGISPTPVVPTLVGYHAVTGTTTVSLPQVSRQTITYEQPGEEGVVVTPLAAYVYAADGIDRFYHASANSHDRENGRALTLAEAQAEGLAPCPVCYPSEP